MKDLGSARERFEQAYELAKGEAPYGTWAIRMLNSLAQFYVRQKLIDEAIEAYKKLDEMFDASAPSNRGQRTKCLLELARLHIGRGQINEAAQQIVKAKKSDPELLSEKQSIHCLYKYAELEIDVDAKDHAFRHLELAERHLLDPSESDASLVRMYAPIITALWRKLGRDDRADTLMSRSQV